MYEGRTIIMRHDSPVEHIGEAERQNRIISYCENAARKLRFTLLEVAAMRRLLANADCPRNDLASNPRLLLNLGLPGVAQKEEPRLSSRPAVPPRVTTLIEAAHQLDLEIEFNPYDDEPLSAALTGDSDSENLGVRFLLPLLRRTSKEGISTLVPKLPVFPAAARKVIDAYRTGTATAASLAAIAGSDALMAGSLIAESKSVRYAPHQPLRSIVQATMYIGTTRACEVMLAAALRPLFANRGVEGLWRHSLEAASTAERIALLTNAMPAQEAYLLGLVHDIGRLLLELASTETRNARDRLISGGTPRAVAEVLICGMDHAEAGAEVLRFWHFPDAFVEAVRWHHEPERCDGKESSLLYLLEFWTDAAEDLPSNARIGAALENLRIGPKDLYDCLSGE
jgi:putative nucleotidyltransferase with HDIG domain